MADGLGTGVGLALVASLVSFGIGYVASRVVHRVNVVDTVWGLAFVAMAVTTFGTSGGHAARRVTLLVVMAVWGVRLSLYLGVRSRGHGEDPRYEAMLQRAKGSREVFALTRVFLLQAVVAWFVALPVQVGMYERSRPNALLWLGAALWLVGFLFEAVGDAQLARFKRDPANRGKVLDRGLWGWTRHPNYFGEACLWTGVWLVAAQQWPGALTVLSPLAMTWFVAAKTGKPLLEKQLMDSKPGYRDYVETTSGFFPRPPKRLASRA